MLFLNGRYSGMYRSKTTAHGSISKWLSTNLDLAMRSLRMEQTRLAVFVFHMKARGGEDSTVALARQKAYQRLGSH